MLCGRDVDTADTVHCEVFAPWLLAPSHSDFQCALSSICILCLPLQLFIRVDLLCSSYNQAVCAIALHIFGKVCVIHAIMHMYIHSVYIQHN